MIDSNQMCNMCSVEIFFKICCYKFVPLVYFQCLSMDFHGVVRHYNTCVLNQIAVIIISVVILAVCVVIIVIFIIIIIFVIFIMIFAAATTNNTAVIGIVFLVVVLVSFCFSG